MEMFIATVKCPKCGKRFALLDTPEYRPEEAPKRFPRSEPITFPCCGDAQTVAADTVEYKAKSEIT